MTEELSQEIARAFDTWCVGAVSNYQSRQRAGFFAGFIAGRASTPSPQPEALSHILCPACQGGNRACRMCDGVGYVPEPEPLSEEIMSDQTIAYLVERADPAHPGNVLVGQFLSFAGQLGANATGGNFEWMRSVQWAIRFARREDAENFIKAMEALSEGLPHRQTMPGLRSGDPRAIVTEHSWS